jgi:hypothetical protein
MSLLEIVQALPVEVERGSWRLLLTKEHLTMAMMVTLRLMPGLSRL